MFESAGCVDAAVTTLTQASAFQEDTAVLSTNEDTASALHYATWNRLSWRTRGLARKSKTPKAAGSQFLVSRDESSRGSSAT